MSLELIDGFDYYTSPDIDGLRGVWDTSSSWQGPGSLNSGVFSYGRCLDMGGNSYLYKTLSNSASRVVAGHFKFSGNGDSDSFVIFRDGASAQIGIRKNDNQTLAVYRGSTLLGTSTNTIPPNGSWMWLSIVAVIDNTTGSVSIKCNNSSLYSLSGVDTQDTSNAYSNVIRIGQWNYSMSVDNLHIDNGSSHLNERRIYFFLGTSDGSLTDFTASTGSDYACIDDNPHNSDTDYISSSTAGHKNTVAAPSLSLVTPKGVKISVVAKKDDAGTRQVRVINRQSTTNYNGTTYDVTTSYQLYSHLWETNPATSSAWSGAEIDATQPGVECVA